MTKEEIELEILEIRSSAIFPNYSPAQFKRLKELHRMLMSRNYD
jgi:hypothetical protein